jgi:adenosine 3'-phospho 5'-phosphosulfate transporter B2
MTRPFDGVYFDASLFLVLCNRLATIAVAVATLTARGGARAVRPAAPLPAYAAVSLTNVVATSCQYEALKYVSFGAQTLSKCLKPVPVMVWGALWLGRAYAPDDVAVAAAVMAGCWLFMGGGGAATARAAAAAASSEAAAAYGVGLLAAYLAADGLTSTLQDRMFDRGAAVTPANQVLYVSLFSAAASVAGLALRGSSASSSGGGVSSAIAFCVAHPAAGAWVAALAASATASSLLITTTVRHYGALVLSLTMTVRQLASVVVSSATYGHPLTAREAAGAALVFSALLARGYTRVRAAAAAPQAAGTLTPAKRRARDASPMERGKAGGAASS